MATECKHRQDVDKYVSDVLADRIVSGRYLKMACRRFVKDERDGKKKGWYVDDDLAARTVDFMEQLQHTKGQWAGQPFKLSAWQKFVVWNVFGFRWIKSRLRRFAIAYATIARAGGKSTFAAAIAITLLYFDEPLEIEAEGYVVATKEDQAARITSQAWRMIDRNPALKKRAEAYKYRDVYKSIVLPGAPYNGSSFKALGSDSKTADSMAPSFNVEDEQHEWREQHRDLKEKIETGDGKRAQCLTFIITTAGSDDSVVWIDQDAEAVAVLESADSGECVDDTLFAFIARLDEARPCECGGNEDCQTCGGTGEILGDDPLDESMWQKANPDLGTCPTVEYLRRQANRSKNNPSLLAPFKRYHANSRIASIRKIINEKLWERAAGELSEWAGNVYGAWDLGWRDDLAAVGAVCDRDGLYELRVQAFCPKDSNRNLNKMPWPKWIDEGWLIVTEGDTTDISVIRDTIIKWSSDYGVAEWAFDERNSLQLAQELKNEYGQEVVAFTQAHSHYNEPIREFLRCLANGKIVHDGNQLLAWCARNLCVKDNNREEMMPDKRKSPEKIDPMVAVLMAFGRAILSDSEPEVTGEVLTF